MLNTETKERLQGLGFDVSELEKAVKSEEEVSLDVPTLYKDKGMSDEDKTIFGNNRFEEGKRAMSEIKAKELKNTHGIDTEGKDLSVVIDAIIDKKIKETAGTPDERVTALETDKKTLQTKLKELEEEKTSLINKHSTELFTFESRQAVKSSLPDKGLVIPKDDITDLFFNVHRVDKDDQGRTIVKKGDEVLKTATLEPIPLKEAVSTFVQERKYVSSNGMGGDDGAGSPSSKKFKDTVEFTEWCTKNNVAPMSPEGQKILLENKADDFKY